MPAIQARGKPPRIEGHGAAAPLPVRLLRFAALGVEDQRMPVRSESAVPMRA
jgi:hypothetical protein